MKKKEYKMPTLKVVNLDSCDIICTSGGSYNETLPKRQFGSPESGPEPDGDGWIWGD